MDRRAFLTGVGAVAALAALPMNAVPVPLTIEITVTIDPLWREIFDQTCANYAAAFGAIPEVGTHGHEFCWTVTDVIADQVRAFNAFQVGWLPRSEITVEVS